MATEELGVSQLSRSWFVGVLVQNGSGLLDASDAEIGPLSPHWRQRQSTSIEYNARRLYSIVAV